jgi:hypothetical protein
MLFDPSRHQLLQAINWDERVARQAIAQIVLNTESSFMPDMYWQVHPLDYDGPPFEHPFTPLHFGACGVLWALHYLQEVGAVELNREYLTLVPAMQIRNRAWLGIEPDESKASFLMGDTAFLMLACTGQPGPTEQLDALAALIEENMTNPIREMMWGSPGTMLAALFMHWHTGNQRWADLYLQTARTLWSQLVWSEEHACHYWIQEFSGQPSSYLDAAHGFVGVASPLISGRHLMPDEEWDAWEACITNTISRTATRDGQLVNWRDKLITPEGSQPRYLMQYCHGAPGFVICLAGLPSHKLDSLLIDGGEAIWAAGPLFKGSNLCHGTGGNGFAFLKLYERTGNAIWLERARAFAMHGISQTNADTQLYGQNRFSLWTGDLGFAIFLWHCIHGTAVFPTLDVFFGANN